MNELIVMLIPLLIQVESSGNNQAEGDYIRGQPQAIGCLQIWPCVVQDVNRIIGNQKYTLQDRYNREKSIEMCKIYLTHYGGYYERKTGKKATMEVLCRCWNGGPTGWKKKSTEKYWKRVKALL